jgi:subtilisin family serine protease
MSGRRLSCLTLLLVLGLLSACAHARLGVKFTKPTDPDWEKKYWGLKHINMEPAWARVPDASAVVIAVVDSGLIAHADIVNTHPGSTECATGDKDEDGHGTKVAGIIAGKPDGKHAVGVAWYATLRSHRFLCPSGFVEQEALEAFEKALAASPKPAIVNASWAHLPLDTGIAGSIDKLVTQHTDVLFVFAAPPGAAPYPPNAPHPYPVFTTRDNVIIVTASDQGNKVPGWAGSDSLRIHIAAPGVGIATADIRPGPPDPPGGTTTFRGASAAAAFVSGCAALVKLSAQTAASPKTLSGKEIRDHLLKTAPDVGTLTSDVIDGNLLNCGAAVTAFPK